MASRLDVTATTNLAAGGGQIQCGADGKMYVANTGAASLATITTPDATPTFTLAGQALAAGKTSTVGLPQTVGNCTIALPDTDGDGVIDLVDIDDDNDGVLDATEVCTYEQMSKTGVTVSSTLGWNAALSLLVDGADATYQAYPNAAAIANQTVLQFDFPTATVLNTIELSAYSTQTAIVVGAVVNIDAWDGTAWVTIAANQTVSTPIAGTFNAAQLAYKFPFSNTTAYTKYRIQGVSGNVQVNWLQEAYFAKVCTLAMNDADGDGITNERDLDADGDGIPDNIEAQTTTGYIAPGLITAVGATGVPLAYNQTTGNTVVDTDADGTPDYLDTNSDNAQGSDTVEGGITLSGTDADKDGLDDAVDTTPSVFGSVNAGITNVMGAYPNVGTQVNWREECPNGKTLISSQYATVSSGGYSSPTLGAGAPDGTGISVYTTGTTYQGIFTYANTFSAGTTINIAAKYNDTRVDGVLLSFSTDNITYTANSALVNSFGAASGTTYTTVSYVIPSTLTGAYKYIRVQGNSANSYLNIDAIQVQNIGCAQFVASSFLDNGAGGGDFDE